MGGALVAVIAALTLAYIIWGPKVLLTVSTINLVVSALWWVRVENRIYGGIMPRISVLMVLIGAMLFVSGDIIGQLGMGLTFVIGIALGIQRGLLNELVRRLS